MPFLDVIFSVFRCLPLDVCISSWQLSIILSAFLRAVAVGVSVGMSTTVGGVAARTVLVLIAAVVRCVVVSTTDVDVDG